MYCANATYVYGNVTAPAWNITISEEEGAISPITWKLIAFIVLAIFAAIAFRFLGITASLFAIIFGMIMIGVLLPGVFSLGEIILIVVLSLIAMVKIVS
jgi:hypothetical protein